MTQRLHQQLQWFIQEFEWEKKLVDWNMFGMEYGQHQAGVFSALSSSSSRGPKVNVFNNSVLIVHGLVGDWGRIVEDYVTSYQVFYFSSLLEKEFLLRNN